MKSDRRKFLKIAGMAGIGVAGNKIFGAIPGKRGDFKHIKSESLYSHDQDNMNSDVVTESGTSMIGLYGLWASSLSEHELPHYSFRRKEWKNLEKWRNISRQRLEDRLAIPAIGGVPEVTIKRQYSYNGLHIEELTWQLPYGRPTEAILLKPLNETKPLPAILAFHDHGGNKYFGTQKITKTSDSQNPLMTEHQKNSYEGFAWANEIAARGYVVLVPDAFSFASRRVMIKDVPVSIRHDLTDPEPDDHEGIAAYNQWAGQHEHIMAKSLFSAGTTWPGLFFAEDRIALDILCARKDVDSGRIGCGGLSGGGLRTVFMGGLDNRIKCALAVGFMTTWKDFLLNKSVNHTWMTYVPLLPNELDFPEILGLRVPLATMVLNDSEDSLYTFSEMKRADNILREVFKKAGAEDNYRCSYYPGPHKFDSAMQSDAFEWFDRWLK
jgi:dienelactone hydrolase